MGRRILIDTGAFLALIYEKDRRHEQAKSFLLACRRNNIQIMTTNFIVAETYTLISTRLGRHYARIWLKHLAWPVERITEDDESRVREILFKYTDKDFSYTDATSFTVMERVGIEAAFTFDRHFAQYGFRILPGAKEY